MLRETAKSLGITKRLHHRQIRHSIATHICYKEKLILEQFKIFLGHASIRSTEIYTHVTDHYLKSSSEL